MAGVKEKVRAQEEKGWIGTEQLLCYGQWSKENHGQGRKGKGTQRTERESAFLPVKSLCLRQPLFPTSSRGLFRAKWPSQGRHFQLLKKPAELLALSST